MLFPGENVTARICRVPHLLAVSHLWLGIFQIFSSAALAVVFSTLSNSSVFSVKPTFQGKAKMCGADGQGEPAGHPHLWCGF